MGCGIARDGPALGLEVASRTDRGVHARGNVLALWSDLPGPSLLGALNGIAPDVWAWRAAPVPESFRVRAATGRWYRYLEPPSPVPLATWRAAADLFRGPIDVRSFGRGLPEEPPSIRPISSVRVTRARRGLTLDVRAPAFVWGMVRKIVAALRAHVGGELDLAELQAALQGRRRLRLPLAEPERLILWEVRLPVRWQFRIDARPRRPFRRLEEAAIGAELRARVARALAPPGVFPLRAAPRRVRGL